MSVVQVSDCLSELTDTASCIVSQAFPSIDCQSAEYKAYLPLFTLLIVLFVAGLPLVLLGLLALLKYRRTLEDSVTRRRFGILCVLVVTVLSLMVRFCCAVTMCSG